MLDAGGTKYAEGYTLVTREDLGSAYYFQPAVQHVSIVDVKIPDQPQARLHPWAPATTFPPSSSKSE